MIEMADIDVHDIEKGISTKFRSPSLHLLSELYFNICVPLRNAAIRGDIEEARCLLKLNHNQSVLSAAITENHETVLHAATDYAGEKWNFVDNPRRSTDDTIVLNCIVWTWQDGRVLILNN
ncbi:hypothetical protein Pint_20947 [Pistacia integerrima]|uniref:Uncharacterized protein n=1 Tax=Pistacia integerrima TaxID=434235 RepID=A0ACC0XB11_9ROSI|nr:hypothetical protein Pint_20947 [Pistacia integerrima]